MKIRTLRTQKSLIVRARGLTRKHSTSLKKLARTKTQAYFAPTSLTKYESFVTVTPVRVPPPPHAKTQSRTTEVLLRPESWWVPNFNQSYGLYIIKELDKEQGILKGEVLLYCWPPVGLVLISLVLQIKTKIVSCHTADSKPVLQEVNCTMILLPLVFPAATIQGACTIELLQL